MSVGRETRLSAWVERFAAHFAEEGIPLIGGRILGYLLVCQPTERTAAELSQELEASSGSISTNLKFLVNAGLVTKRTRRGRQAAQYRIDEKRWVDLVQRKLDALVSVRELTEAGMRLMSGDPERAMRLRTVDEVYTWLATELPAVWERRPSSTR
ncbi:GbsR/MarR family transcriptional regulator [Actinosynnema sp. NPDC059335]|uniref:GbsR/MarR family transcriptional regulator n=1 Tax=Actinosynnema sp. NPDC059335 TaxID=3346804 RepID=UPI003670F709